MTDRVRFLLSLAIATALASLPVAQVAAADTTHLAAPKAEQLNALYEAYWEEALALRPVQATVLGDRRYLAQLPDYLSADYRQQDHGFVVRWLQAVEAIGPAGLSGQDLLSYQIFVRNLRRALEAETFPDWMQPVDQFASFLLRDVVQLGSGTGAQPFKSVQDYDHWLLRGQRLPVVLGSTIAAMRQGMQAGVVQPRVLMEKVLPQLDALIKDKPEDTLFWGPIQRMPADFPAADKTRLTAAYRTLIANQLMPAYRELRGFIADEYLPKARSSFGMNALPNGQAWYAFKARSMTTTDRSPADIHALGLAEVARIHGEMRKVMQQVGFSGSLQQFFVFMRTDPRFAYKSEAELLAHFHQIEARVNQHVATQFALIPKAAFEIRPVEAHRAASASRGQYIMASEDGTRPGIFYVNTSDLPSRRRWASEELYLHEAIPGHFYEVELRRELTTLPKFRRYGGTTAFSEGWGLYAESLGREVGLYTDPYSWFGRLQNELWRAIRLVVDTGLHDQGWSREQVIRYMLENSAVSETDAVAEAERYMAWPGQALAYKIGELKIRELRTRAERALGDRFDVRRFHAEVLKDGSVPLDVLEAKIDRWIAAERTQ